MVDILSPLTVDGKVRSKDVSTLDSTDSDDTLAPKGYVDSVSESKLDTTGGLLTGPLTVEGGANINTSGHIEGTMLRTTADTHLAMAPPKYAVLDSSGWICHRSLDETKSDLGITGKQDKLEAGMNITIDGNMISAKGTTYEVATETSDGLMSSGDKSQLIALDSAISTHVNSTSNPHNVTKSQIGLGDVDNTSDLYKPISIAVQEALNRKADRSEISRIYRPCGSVATINDLPSDAQIGDVYDVAETGMNYAWVEIGGVAKWDSLGMLSDKIDMTNYYTREQVDSTVSGLRDDIGAKSTVSVTRSLTSGTKIGTITINGTDTHLYCNPPTTVDAALSSTSTNPVQNKVINTALLGKQNTLTAGSNISIDDNVISAVDTKYGVATQSDNGLMSSADKKKLDGIATGANKTTVDTALSNTSTNPVQNKVINTALAGKAGTSVATTSANGLMSSTDKSKLDGITEGADAVSFTRSLTSGTKVGTITINGAGTDIYCQTNTDTKVTQNNDTSTDAKLPILVSATADSTTARTGTVKYVNGKAYINPSTGNLFATKFVGPLVGNVTGNSDTATKATQDSNGNNIVNTYETKANAITGLSVSGRTITYTKGDGSTGTITTQDNNTDTKNTAGSTDTSSKIFLIGATSQAANPQTYSHDTAYVGTDGKLYSGGKVVIASGDKATSAGSADSATKATQDANGNNIVNTYETKANAITGLSVSGRTITYTKGDGSTGTITTQDNNTDTKVTQTNSTGTGAYPILLKNGTGTETITNTVIFDDGVTIQPSTGTLTATKFKGPLTGNVTGNCSGSSGSCTGNSATATALNVSSTSAIAITAGVQFISTTILSQTGNWFIETHVSGTNIFQRATSMADPSNVCVRTSSNSGSSWNGWVFSYAVWK